MTIAERLAAVRARIAVACTRADRDPDSVALLAVSKTRAPADVAAARAAGQRAFGENRVQELLAKSEELSGEDLEWHSIGSLQTNKVQQLLRVPNLALVHSVDRQKLVDKLAAAADGLDCLLQIDATEDTEKHGATPVDALAVARLVAGKAKRNDGDDMRPVMDALAAVGKRTGVALLASRHNRKADTSKAVHIGGGSIEMAAAVRSLLVCVREPTAISRAPG